MTRAARSIACNEIRNESRNELRHVARGHGGRRAPSRLHLRLKPIAFALACMGVAPAMAQVLPTALPTGGNPVAGSVVIGAPTIVNGITSLGITQSSNRAIIDWTSFSIGSQSAVNVNQLSAASVLLNRVTGAQASVISGRLTSTLASNPAAVGGSIYLVNPNGVTFTNGAVVNVGGLLASTMDVDGITETTRNASFMNGGVIDPATATAQLGFTKANGNTSGVTVQSGASITAGRGEANAGGSITLLGASVVNAGSLQATRGAVNLGSADKLTLVVDPVGDGLTTLRIVNPSTLNALVQNTGTIAADGGLVALRAASTASETVVRQSGVLRARTLETRGGQIVLDGSAGASGNLVSIEGGRVDATGTSGTTGTAAAGGSVTIDAQQMRMSAGSIDASGGSGGHVSVFARQSLTMAPAASISADGTAGAGGTIDVAADSHLVDVTTQYESGSFTVVTGGAAHVSGALTAKGATDGGSITTSAGTLEVSRTAVIDASGGTGVNGLWTANTTRDLQFTSTYSYYVDPVYSASSMPSRTGTSVIADAAIGGTVGRATDVVIDSSVGASAINAIFDGIFMNFGVQIEKAAGRQSSLTLNSDRNITGQGVGITAAADAGPLNVYFNVDAHGTVVTGNAPMTSAESSTARAGYINVYDTRITTQGGDIRFYGQSDPARGRAVGGAATEDNSYSNGIYLGSSVLDTCIGIACTGNGSIVLRGQGATTIDSDRILYSGAGITLQGSTLRTGAGAMRLDGAGGLGSDGVSLTGLSGEGGFEPTSVHSTTGDITLTGRSRDWIGTDTPGTYDAFLLGRANDGSSAGVALSNSALETGGNVAISGIGGSMSAALSSSAFTGGVASVDGSVFDASNGIALSSSSITAGAGKTISMTGTAGSRGFTVYLNPITNGVSLVQNAFDASAVSVLALPTDGLLAAGGSIVIDGGSGDVSLRQVVPVLALARGSATAADADATDRTLVSTASTTSTGGSIVVSGRNVLLQGDAAADHVARLDSSGATGGGSVSLRATAVAGQADSGIVAVDSSTVLAADATTAGNGGNVTLFADTSLTAYGAIRAKGAGASGAGGTVSTSGGTFDLRGMRVYITGPRATGHWLLDPFDIAITHGTAAGSLTANPFVALSASIIQDGDINNALNQGASVSIGTGAGGSPTSGDITFGAGVLITPGSGGVAGQTLEFDAQRSIRSLSSNVAIGVAGTSPLNVVFRADANNSGPSVGGGQISYDGAIYTNGGSVTMSGNWSATGQGDTALHLTGIVDTRVTSNASGLGGNITLNGFTTTPVANVSSDQPGVWLDGSTLRSASGNIVVNGSSTNNTGVLVDGTSNTQGIFSTTGSITVTGLGTDTPPIGSGSPRSSSGVLVRSAGIGSTTGAIALRGNVADTAQPNSTSAGAALANGATVSTSGAGDIELTGSAAANGRGVWVQATPVGSTSVPNTRVTSGRNVVLRAGNQGTSDAITIDAPVTAANAIDLRPGAVDATGAGVDRTGVAITLGTGATVGFGVSNTDFAQLTAASIVAGGNVHTGNITVAGALATSAALTLQNNAGGSIQLNGPVAAANLGLISAGDISQAATAPISAGNLLARSINGNVSLQATANDVGNVGGSSAGSFSYVDANAVTIAAVSVPRFDVATGLPQVETASALNVGGSGLVSTLTQDLVVGTDLNVGSLLALNANGAIRSANAGVVIQGAGSGPLITIFNAGRIDYGGAIYTNGGDVAMSGTWRSGGATDSALRLSGTVDTRVGRSDVAGTGGNLNLTGFSTTTTPDPSSGQPALWLNGSTISTASGNVVLNGSNANNTGVRIDGTAPGQGLFTTTGNITVLALGTDTPAASSGVPSSASGLAVSGATIRAGTSAIVLRGNVTDTTKAGSTSAGVVLANGANVSTTGGGDIELTGSAAANGRGVWLQANGTTGPATTVSGSRDVVLRAVNDGTTDAITIAAPVVTVDTIDLRPGALSTARLASDRTATPITLGAGATTGFAVSNADIAQLTAARIVAGSNAQAADITVTGALNTLAALTLQNSAGGNIQLNGAVAAASVGLVSAGNISQAATAGITAGSLLARSIGGSVDLQSAANNVGTVAGSALGSFSYRDADALTIAAVTASGFDAAGNLPSTDTAATLDAASVFVRTVTQDITLSTDVNAATSVELDANRSIRSGNASVAVQATTGGPMNVTFNADADNAGPSTGGGQIAYAGAVYTNGGNVTMKGNWLTAGGNDSALRLTGIVDTRVGRSNTAGVGGNVTLNGSTTAPGGNPSSTQPGVWLNGAVVSTASGNVVINGSNGSNTGVRIDGTGIAQGLFTTSGNIAVNGLGTDRPAGGTFNPLASSFGIVVDGAGVRSATGAVVLRGNVTDTAKANSTSAGLALADGATVSTSGASDIELTGSATANGRGLWISPTASSGGPSTLPATNVASGRNLLLRADNDGTADAITIDAPVAAVNAIDLRPGRVVTATIAADSTTAPITLGTGAATGFALSNADIAQASAATIVVGSDTHAGNITVTGALSTAAALTLQNGAGGTIQLNGPVTAASVGLLSAGNIGQAATSSITGNSLLARSGAGNVDLRSAANNVRTVGGSATGSFSYVDADAVSVSAVSAPAWNAANNVPTTVAASTLNAASALVRTITQDLTLATGVVSAGDVDLVAGSRFQNPANQAITATNWRVWADTWLGETRGGLAGSGSLPNLYGCAYLGVCAVTVPATGNHFVYAQRPTATVTVDNATRELGSPDPAFTYSVSGLILGDAAANISGTPVAAATAASPPGNYAIGGTFTSTAGYAVTVVPGQLAVTGSTVRALSAIPVAEAFHDTSNVYTYTFDRNFGPPQICAATGPLDGDRVSQGSDVLAREWTRVRSRPNLTSCVATDRRNGCADF